VLKNRDEDCSLNNTPPCGGEGGRCESGCERGNLHGEPFTLTMTLSHEGALFVTPFRKGARGI